MSDTELRLFPARAPTVERIWRDLERQAVPPYFLTWGWIENWIACLPPEETPPLAVLFKDDAPTAAFFLSRRWMWRHRAFPSRALHLNVTGVPCWDELLIEHNAVLHAPATRLSLAAFMGALTGILPQGWDELLLPALARNTFPGNALGEPLPTYRVRIDREVAAPFIDLGRVRAAKGYLDLLGAGTRAQIRRAQRGFGKLTLEVAGDATTALSIYDELAELHTRSWRARGSAGAFADPWFDRFHRRLIVSRIGSGEIQLLRVRAAVGTVGCLYNFVASGRVLFYQSGLAQFADAHLKPGYVCHAEAVHHNAAAGHAVYDLLGGESRYKKNLATDETTLVWACIQRPLARFAVEDRLRIWKRALLNGKIDEGAS